MLLFIDPGALPLTVALSPSRIDPPLCRIRRARPTGKNLGFKVHGKNNYNSVFGHETGHNIQDLPTKADGWMNI